MRLWPSLRAMLRELLESTRPDVPPPSPPGVRRYGNPCLHGELLAAGWALYRVTDVGHLLRSHAGPPN